MSLLNVIETRKNPIIFDKENRFVFFPNNKVCQQSVARGALKDRSIVMKHQPDLWEKRFRAMDETFLAGIFKFTLVRNPFDRAVSAFSYLKDIGIIPSGFTFRTFCIEILDKTGTFFNPHFDEQSDGVFSEGKLIVDFVGRFENLVHDWHLIAEKIESDVQELPIINKSSRQPDYAAYYDAETIAIISRIYRQDIENFDYRFKGKMYPLQVPGLQFASQSSSGGGSANCGEIHFIRRECCPICGSKSSSLLYSSPFNTPPIRDYLASFYGQQGGVEFQYLHGVDFVIAECKTCGLIYQRDIPDDFLMNKLYDQWINPELVNQRRIKARHLDTLIDRAEEIMIMSASFQVIPSTLKVLDFGMGWGEWVLMAKALGCDTYGYDIADSRNANAKAQGFKTITYGEMPETRFNFINAEQVFEHIPAPLETLRHLANSLTSDGFLRISVPDGTRIKNKLNALHGENGKWNESMKPIAPLEHINCFNRRSLKTMANLAGLEPFVLPWKKVIGYRLCRTWLKQPGNFLKSILECAGLWKRPGIIYLKKVENR